MTKQKVEMKLAMRGAKIRSKALKTVVGLEGVTSATAEEEKIVVVGDGVDSVVLTEKLRKKMRCFVELTSVTEEKADSNAEKKPKDGGKPVTQPEVWVYPPLPHAHQYEIQEGQPPCCRIV